MENTDSIIFFIFIYQLYCSLNLFIYSSVYLYLYLSIYLLIFYSKSVKKPMKLSIKLTKHFVFSYFHYLQTAIFFNFFFYCKLLIKKYSQGILRLRQHASIIDCHFVYIIFLHAFHTHPKKKLIQLTENTLVYIILHFFMPMKNQIKTTKHVKKKIGLFVLPDLYRKRSNEKKRIPN